MKIYLEDLIMPSSKSEIFNVLLMPRQVHIVLSASGVTIMTLLPVDRLEDLSIAVGLKRILLDSKFFR